MTVLAKNKQETDSLDADCVVRKGAYASAWKAAQDHYTAEEPKVDGEEQEKYDSKKNLADTALAAVQRDQNKLAVDAEDLKNLKQEDFETKEATYNEKVAEHHSAVASSAKTETQYTEETMPAQKTENLKVFTEAKSLIDTAKTDTMGAATAAKTRGIETCNSVTDARRAHVDADDALLNEQIKPLIDQLTSLKCVDAITAENFHEKKAAWHAKKAEEKESAHSTEDATTLPKTNLLQVASETKSKCALTKSKMASFIETSHFLGTVSLDGQFKIFTDRVASERTHMENLHDACISDANTAFEDEKKAADTTHENAEAGLTSTKDDADALLVTGLATLRSTNAALVKAKLDAIDAPKAAKELAQTALNDANADLSTKMDTKTRLEGLAQTTHANALAAALATKNSDISTRKAELATLKSIASTAHDEDKAFVDGYCTDSRADLVKEAEVLKMIEEKLGGLTQNGMPAPMVDFGVGTKIPSMTHMQNDMPPLPLPENDPNLRAFGAAETLATGGGY